MAQSWQPSASWSEQTKRFVGAESATSTTPSLSSSESPTLQRPSASVSVPSLAGAWLPPAQSSQPSTSRSEQTERLVGAASDRSATPSLSSSVSPPSQRPSPSTSGPSFSGANCPVMQSSQ